MNTQIVRHGEVILLPTTLPEGARLLEETNETIVAHSETGHHHILQVKDKVDMTNIKVYSFNGEKYYEVKEMAELWHAKTGNEVHKTHKIVPTVYKLIIKKSYDYFTKKLSRVRD